MLYFIALETMAIGVTIASAIAGISIRFAAESLTPVFRILPVGAAVVAAILPILFFGDPKRRNRTRRHDEKRAINIRPSLQTTPKRRKLASGSIAGRS
jgi:hypothetical protein